MCIVCRESAPVLTSSAWGQGDYSYIILVIGAIDPPNLHYSGQTQKISEQFDFIP
jgi:hypothetical protein